MIALLALLLLWTLLLSRGLQQRARILRWVHRAVRPSLEAALAQIGTKERFAEASQTPEVLGYVLGLVWERGRQAGLSDLRPELFVELTGRAFRRIWGTELGARMSAALQEAIAEHPARLRRALRQGRLDGRRRLLGTDRIEKFSDLLLRPAARWDRKPQRRETGPRGLGTRARAAGRPDPLIAVRGG